MKQRCTIIAFIITFAGLEAGLIASAHGPQPFYIFPANEFNKEPVSDEELSRYVYASLSIHLIQEGMQENMWTTADEKGIKPADVYRFLSNMQAGRDLSSFEISDSESGQLLDMWDIIQRQMLDLQEMIILAIEATGLRMSRFEEIYEKVHAEPGFHQKALSLLHEKIDFSASSPDRQMFELVKPILEEVGRSEVTPDFPEYIHHVVSPGDTYWEIAEMYLGNPDLWISLLEENITRSPNPANLLPGLQIRIPVDDLIFSPKALMEADEKFQIVKKIFPVEDFPFKSFAYLNQQLELRAGISIYVTLSQVRQQINANRHLREELYQAPDFLAVLIPPKNANEPGDENTTGVAIDNMVIDETRTPFGSDFYDRFRNQLDIPEHPGGFFIRVVERPVPGRGSQMAIEVNYEVIYQFQLQPGYEQVIEIADAAAQGLNRYLSDYDESTTEYY